MIFHHVVGSTVLLEDIVDIDDVGMSERRDGLCLTDELLLEADDRLAAAAGAKGDRRCVGMTLTEILHEELLDRHLAVKAGLDSQICDAEAALTEQILYRVLAAFEDGTVFQMHNDFGLSYELQPKGSILLTAKQTAHAYCTKWWDLCMK